MNKKEKVILQGLVPKVDAILGKNTSKFKRCIDKFINDRNQFIFDTCPCDRIYYSEDDANEMFNASGVDRETISKYIHQTYYYTIPSFNPRAAKDDITILMMCIIRYFLITKRDRKNAELAMIYLAFSGKFYPSVHYMAFPKAQPSEYRYVMEYVVNNMLSNKFYLKTEGNVFGSIKKFGTTWLDTYNRRFKEFEDEDIVYLIQQLRDRIKTFMKSIASMYYKAYENKDYLTYDKDSFDQGDFHLADSDSLRAERYVEKAMQKLNTSSVDYKLCKMCSDVNVGTQEIKNIIEAIISQQENNLLMKEVVRTLVYTYFAKDDRKDVTDIRFITFSVAPKPNTRDPHILRMREIIEKWLETESVSYRKRKHREPTRNSYFRSITLYFTLVIHTSNK